VKVPFLDLRAQDRAIGHEVRAALLAVLDDQQFVLSHHVERFEADMAAYCGVPHAIGVGSGTDALVLMLSALGVGPGTMVLTTPFSFFATASTIARLVARPLFADIDPQTMNLDPAAAEEALGRADGPVAGLLPVHLFGRLADLPAYERLADRHGMWLAEDAAQAIGARANGVRAGGLACAAALSFYPTKNLGGVGDGGMLLTRDAGLAARVRRDRHQGMTAPYVHETVGLCSRLDAVQAAVLAVKLRHLESWNARRRTIARWYAERFVDAGLAGRTEAPLVLPEPAGEAHVFHVYTIRARDRDGLAAHLAREGIGTQVYYRVPLHRQPALAAAAVVEGALPEAERAAAEVLSLPIYPELREEQVQAVVDAAAGFYTRSRRAL